MAQNSVFSKAFFPVRGHPDSTETSLESQLHYSPQQTADKMEFVNLGAHCSEMTCKQQDFLPFLCEHCKLYFCKDHRTHHNCSAYEESVFKCPVCSKGIGIKPGQDPNYLWEFHFNSGNCKKSSSQVCCAPKCRKKLTQINSIKCSDCGKTVCLSHRYKDQHPCKAGLRKPNKKNCFLF